MCHIRPVALACAAITVFLVVHNLAKVPYYMVNLPATNVTWDAQRCDVESPEHWCRGMEVTVHFGHWFGYRSVKVFADPTRFLSIHTVMGSFTLLIMFLVLVGKVTMVEGAPAWQASTTVLWLHLLPYFHGIPARKASILDPPESRTGLANLMAVAIWIHAIGVCVFLASRFLSDEPYARSMLILSYLLTIFPYGAAALEFRGIITNFLTGVWSTPPEGDKPLWWSGDPVMDPYSQILSPAVGIVVSFLIAIGGTVAFVLAWRREPEKRDAELMEPGAEVEM